LNLFSTASGGTGLNLITGRNGFVSTPQNPSISNVSTAASGSYMLTVTDKMLAITANINIIIKKIGSATPQSICSAGLQGLH
jgi:hypothetical protein